MPNAAQAMAATVRRGIRSPNHQRLSRATAAGIAAITTPADTAEVSKTP